jgi:GNAT superfamily N-acetyltransferase
VLDVDGEEPWLRAPADAYQKYAGRLWVAELGGALVACAGLRPLDRPGTVELKSLYVAAAARRRGLGELLVEIVESEARAWGAERVELWSDTRFTDGHRLYSRLGYEQVLGTRELHDLSRTTEYGFAKALTR